MEARRKKGVVTSTTAVIAEGVVRVLDVLFNGVERKNKAAVVMNKKSAPNGHAEKAVTLKLCALLKKETNVITEGTQWENRVTGFPKRVKPIHLWPSLPLLAGFQGWDHHLSLLFLGRFS